MHGQSSLSAVDAITGRRSIRRYLQKPVPEETLRAILEVSARAPSGTNSQPWFVHTVTGAARARVVEAVTEAAKANNRIEDYPYMPKPLPEPYKSRRRKVGFDLYALYGIAKDDMEARNAASLRNYEFFGAPVGLFFFIVGSIGCALSGDIDHLIFFRCVQGLGASSVMVIPRAIIRDLHTGIEATRLMSTVMLVFSVSPILAPLVGSG